MGGARHPKPYIEGKSQVTIPWKRRVIAKLEHNEREGINPFRIEHLKKLVGAPKGSLNTLFKLDKEPPQLTSGYAEAITRILGVTPPLVEQDGDDEQFVRDVLALRELTPDERRDLMSIAARMSKKQ